MDRREGSGQPTTKKELSSGARCGNRTCRANARAGGVHSDSRDYFAERMSESILHAIVAQKEHNHGKERLQVENENLINIFAEIEVKYEQKRLSLLVAKANVMLVQETTKHTISDLRRELATTQYTTSMGTKKVWVIL